MPGNWRDGGAVWVPVTSITQYCDPYTNPWVEGGSTFTTRDVWDCLENGLTEKKSYSTSQINWSTAKHIRRVAYLVRYGWKDPIEIDVGIPGLHDSPYRGWIVSDGNHRLAAAVARGDENIKCNISGSIELAETLFGLVLRNENSAKSRRPARRKARSGQGGSSEEQRLLDICWRGDGPNEGV